MKGHTYVVHAVVLLALFGTSSFCSEPVEQAAPHARAIYSPPFLEGVMASKWPVKNGKKVTRGQLIGQLECPAIKTRLESMDQQIERIEQNIFRYQSRPNDLIESDEVSLDDRDIWGAERLIGYLQLEIKIRKEVRQKTSELLEVRAPADGWLWSPVRENGPVPEGALLGIVVTDEELNDKIKRDVNGPFGVNATLSGRLFNREFLPSGL